MYRKGASDFIMYGDIDSELYPKGRFKTIMLAKFNRIYLHKARINSVYTTSYTPTRRHLTFSYTDTTQETIPSPHAYPTQPQRH